MFLGPARLQRPATLQERGSETKSPASNHRYGQLYYTIDIFVLFLFLFYKLLWVSATDRKEGYELNKQVTKPGVISALLGEQALHFAFQREITPVP